MITATDVREIATRIIDTEPGLQELPTVVKRDTVTRIVDGFEELGPPPEQVTKELMEAFIRTVLLPELMLQLLVALTFGLDSYTEEDLAQ